jgi:hypothetical protein
MPGYPEDAVAPRLLLKKKRGGQVSAVRQADGSQAPLSHS